MLTQYQVVRYLNNPNSCKTVEYKNTFDDFDSAQTFANANNISGFTIVPFEKVTETQELNEQISFVQKEIELIVCERNERIIALFSFVIGCIGYAYLLGFWSHS